MNLTEGLSQNKTVVDYLLGQVVSEPISKVRPVENARTSYVYEVNDHLIVKFPSQRTDVSGWVLQSENAPALKKMLSFRIPEPSLKEVALTSTSPSGMLSLCYEKIPGRVIPRREFGPLSTDFKKHFFEQLSDVVMQLQSIDPNKLPSPPLPTEDMVRKMLPIKQNNKIFNGLLNSFLYFPVLGFDHAPKRVLSHLDLHSGNVCLDEKDNIVGILDFDTLSQGVPFGEFRPMLFRDQEDIQLFRQTYERKSGRKISDKDLQWMEVMFKVIRTSSAVARIRKISSFKKRANLSVSSRDRELF